MLIWPKIIRKGINMISNRASKDLDEEAASSKEDKFVIYLDRCPMMQHKLLAG